MKKRNTILLLILVLMLSMVVLSACASTQVDLDDYMNNGENGSGNLTLIGRMVQGLHGAIGSYGVTVIVFTIILKVVTLPLDFWQRYAMRKSSLKMAALQPVLDEIDRNYGNNPQKVQQEKQKLYKQQSVSSLASCLPMIVTMAVFIIMFNGLTNYATFNSVTNYNDLRNFYNSEYTIAYEQQLQERGYYQTEDESQKREIATLASATARELASNGNYEDGQLVEVGGHGYIGIGQYYLDNIQESFLWIVNIWEPDTWSPIMPDYQKFKTSVNLDHTTGGEEEYNHIRRYVLATHNTRAGDDGSWNGLMILPLLSVGLSFLSIFVTQKMDKKNKKGEEVATNSQQAATNKTMMFIMPLMMAFFGFMYTGAFAIYMTCNYTLSILSTILLKKPIDKLVEKNLAKNPVDKNTPPKANYMR